MKLKILATGMAPDYYTISGEVITAHLNGMSEEYDLSTFPEGGVYQGAEQINGTDAIRNVERVDGVLQVTLAQEVGPGNWKESNFFDAETYDADSRYAIFDASKGYAGTAWVKTRHGKVSPTGALVA